MTGSPHEPAHARRPHPLDDHGRPETRDAVGERETLLYFLEFQRATLRWKCADLSDDQLHRAAVPTSTMTLGGLLMHLAYVEDYWFSEVLAGAEVAPWAGVDWRADGDWDWHVAAGMTGEQLRAQWAESCERSRGVVADRDLAETHAGGVSTRWILGHMVEEYARHNGHADLLREAIDGQTGE